MSLTQCQNNMFKYFRFRTSRNRTLWLLLTLLNLLGFPLWYTLENVLYRPSHILDGGWEFHDLMEVIPLISAATIGIATIISLIVVYLSFDYLSNKVLCDMIYSAPITNNKRFVSDWLSGLFTAVSPFAIGIIVGYIPAIISEIRFGSDMDGTRAAPNLEMYGIIAVTMILALVLAYAIGAFVTMCCGTKFESIAYTIMLHALVPISIVLTVYGMFGFLSGSFYKNGINEEVIVWKLIIPTSPVGIVANGIMAVENAVDDYSYYSETLFYNVFGFKFLFIVIGIIVGLFALTMYLNSKRKAEKCGSPFVFKGLYYVCISLFVYCLTIAVVNCDEFSLEVFIVVMTIIAYMLLEVLKNRGFKKLWVGAIRLVITFALTFSIANGLTTIGDTIEQEVPTVASIESVVLDYPSFITGESFELEITDDETIKNIVSVHKDKVEDLNKFKNRDIYYSHTMSSDKTLGIKYILKGNGTLVREYSVDSEELFTLLSIEKSQQLKDAYCERITEIIEYTKRADFDGDVNIQSFDYRSNGSMDVEVSEYLEAYLKDIQALSIEEFLLPKSQPIAQTMVWAQYSDVYFPLYENFTNALAYLEANDQKEFIDEYYGTYTIKPNSSEGVYLLSPNMKGSVTMRDYSTDMYNEVHEYYDFSVMNHVAGTYFDGGYFAMEGSAYANRPDMVVGVNLEDERLKQLFEVMLPIGVSEKPLYAISVNCNIYLIPEEYSSLAEELFKEGKNLNEYYYKDILKEDEVKYLD